MKPECSIGQPFGGNATPTYSNQGLKGHTGVDSGCGYGSKIHSYWDNEYVYKVLTKENPANDGSGFTGVFTVVDNGTEVFEFLYGHCNPSVTVGQILTKGTVIGTEANNGEVYSNGVRITLEMQKAGNHSASHRHDQKRILKKVKEWNNKDQFLSAPNGGAYFKDGYYYMIPDYNNGYNGCVDWPTTTQSKPIPALPEHFLAFQSALENFQKKEGLTPYPQVGPQTKKALNKYLTIKYE